MDVEKVCRELLAALGGADNVQGSEACMTRLRVSVRDRAKVDLDALRAVEGVLGLVESDTLQIVFGPSVVNRVADAFGALVGGTRGAEDAAAVAKRNKDERSARLGGSVRALLGHVANVFVPLLPGIIAAGLINGLCNVFTVWTGGALSGTWWYECVHTLGWALFAYLPLFVGYLSAREFGGTAILGGIAGALCVANAAMPLLASYGDAQPILPMTGAVYNPASGGLLAALFAGGLFAALERAVRRVMPSLVDTFLSPLVVLVVGGFAVVVAIQPVAAVLTQGVYALMSFVYEQMGVAGGYLLAAGFLPLVSVGLHQALTPIHVMLNDPSGPTGGVNYLLPVLMMAGGGQVGAALALYLKTKSGKLKGYIRDSIPVAILGVGEPLMYAVMLPLGRPFVTACLGAGFGGAAATLFHVGAVSQGVSGLFGVLVVEAGMQVPYLVSMAVACLGGFVLTWFFGVNEQHIEEVYGAQAPS